MLSLRKSDVKTLIEAITGHCVIGTHVERIGRNFYDYCRSYQQLEEEETIENLFCHCPAYNRTRNHLLGNYILSNLSDIVATDKYKGYPKICAAVKMVVLREIGGVTGLHMVSQ